MPPISHSDNNLPAYTQNNYMLLYTLVLPEKYFVHNNPNSGLNPHI